MTLIMQAAALQRALQRKILARFISAINVTWGDWEVSILWQPEKSAREIVTHLCLVGQLLYALALHSWSFGVLHRILCCLRRRNTCLPGSTWKIAARLEDYATADSRWQNGVKFRPLTPKMKAIWVDLSKDRSALAHFQVWEAVLKVACSFRCRSKAAESLIWIMLQGGPSEGSLVGGHPSRPYNPRRFF